jgi:hypothetical protein
LASVSVEVVDITGRATASGSIHQKYLGLTGYIPGLNKWYGGTSNDAGQSVVQTSDGGYAIAGYSNSVGTAGSDDVYLVKTEVNGEFGLARIDSTANTLILYRGANDAYWNYVRVRIWKID